MSAQKVFKKKQTKTLKKKGRKKQIQDPAKQNETKEEGKCPHSGKPDKQSDKNFCDD